MGAALPSKAKRSVWRPASSETVWAAVCPKEVPVKLLLAPLLSGSAKVASACPPSSDTATELPPIGVLARTLSA